VFFPDRSLSRGILFPSTNFLSAQSPFEDGIREVSFLPRFVPLNTWRASACQARACTGAEGFIYLEESVTLKQKMWFSGLMETNWKPFGAFSFFFLENDGEGFPGRWGTGDRRWELPRYR
jgi:hypothetical protein